MRIVFIGTVRFSQRMLLTMLSARIHPVAVYCVAPEGATRISDWADVPAVAKPAGIECHGVWHVATPENVARIRELEPDLILVMGLSQLLPPALLSIPKIACIGSHPSLLPKHRGRAPIPWQIILGEREGGLTFFGLTSGVDDGPVWAQQAFPIAQDETASTLYTKVVVAGELMLVPMLRAIEAGTLKPRPQAGIVTTNPKRTDADGEFSWSWDIADIERLVRATGHPYPGAWFRNPDGSRVRVWSVRCTKERPPDPVIEALRTGYEADIEECKHRTLGVARCPTT